MCIDINKLIFFFKYINRDSGNCKADEFREKISALRIGGTD